MFFSLDQSPIDQFIFVFKNSLIKIIIFILYSTIYTIFASISVIEKLHLEV